MLQALLLDQAIFIAVCRLLQRLYQVDQIGGGEVLTLQVITNVGRREQSDSINAVHAHDSLADFAHFTPGSEAGYRPPPTFSVALLRPLSVGRRSNRRSSPEVTGLRRITVGLLASTSTSDPALSLRASRAGAPGQR
ncbi:hypothetical protein FQZ97_1070070 [compost metagenome]